MEIERALPRRSALALAVVYLLLCVAETVRLTVTGDGGLLFWTGTLGTAGALLLAGAGPHRHAHERRDGHRVVAVVAGAALGLPATAWTVVVPLLAVGVVVLALRSLSEPATQPG